MSNTRENLEAAFAGESQASRRYLYFAEKADKDGYPQVARLFRAASEAETVHARNHLRVMDGIGPTTDNLKEAADGESHEFTEMYPDFIKQAKAENNQGAETSFNHANAVEKIHHGLYLDALKAVEKEIRGSDQGGGDPELLELLADAYTTLGELYLDDAQPQKAVQPLEKAFEL